MGKLLEQFNRLALDGFEVRNMTGWSQSMINDYLAIQNALELLATEIDSLTNFITPSSINVVTGTTIAGDVNSVQQLHDGNFLHVGEVTGAPGFDIKFNFSRVGSVRGIVSRIRYDGIESHLVTLRILDKDTPVSDQYLVVNHTETAYQYRTVFIPQEAKYLGNDNTVEATLYHDDSGNASHDVYIDYIAILGRNT